MDIVVITGGPHAGKTETLKVVKHLWADRVMILPETATMLLSGGFPQPGKDVEWSDVWSDNFQRAVAATQRSMENLHQHEAKKLGIELIICDRGILDGAAYAGGIERFCPLVGIDHSETLERYSAVIHLESMATAKPEIYSNASNACRYENLEEAQALELRTRQAWWWHPQNFFVPGTGTLEQTIEKVIGLLSTITERRIAS